MYILYANKPPTLYYSEKAKEQVITVLKTFGISTIGEKEVTHNDRKPTTFCIFLSYRKRLGLSKGRFSKDLCSGHGTPLE